MITIPVEGPIVTSRRDTPVGLDELKALFRRPYDTGGRGFVIQGRTKWQGIGHSPGGVEHYVLTAVGAHTERQNVQASAACGRVLFGLVVLVEIGHEMQ